ncbi:MAG TPA: cytochrome c oxidase subunit 3 [Limnochordia bacterium]
MSASAVRHSPTPAVRDRSDQRRGEVEAGGGSDGHRYRNGDGRGGNGSAGNGTGVTPAEIGVTILLVAVTMLFIGFTSAYLARREAADWAVAPLPPVLWLNTAVLLVSTLTLHVAQSRARGGERRGAAQALWATFVLGAAFVIGQLVAWRVLSGAGFSLSSSAHGAFFYLLSGVHGVHLLGGMVVLGWAGRSAVAALPVQRLAARIRLTALYWDFLTVLWIYLFALLYVV